MPKTTLKNPEYIEPSSQSEGDEGEQFPTDDPQENLESYDETPTVFGSTMDTKVALEVSPTLRFSSQASQPTLNERRKEVQKFLNYVAAGRQNEAEEMLIKDPTLANATGDLVEGKRSFRWITGLQHAMWSLDWYMWTMIRKYLKPADLQQQILDSQDPNNALWINKYGVDASSILDELIAAYKTTIQLYKDGKYQEGDAAWLRVGAIQGKVPVHVAQEYCHEKRAFSPTPDFSDFNGLTRTLETDAGEWFTCSYNGGLLGEHAVLRGAHKEAQATGVGRGIPWEALEADLNSLQALKEARVNQRLAMINASEAPCRIKVSSV